MFFTLSSLNSTLLQVLLLMSCFSFVFSIPISLSHVERNQGRRAKGIDISFQRVKTRSLQRRNGEIGLGDNSDLLYTVPIQIGPTLTSLHLDTGSSDLWVTTDACTTASCGKLTTPSYPMSSFNASGSSVTMNYGDSTTGTKASGPIGFDTTTLAGIAIEGQSFAAVISTTNTVVQDGAAGIFGLGFPAGSNIQAAVVEAQSGPLKPTDTFLEDTYKYGPLLARIAATTDGLEDDVFSISLQRSEIDVGIDNGTLTIGKLPDGVDNSSLTWVPVRLYSPSEGGLSPPTFATDEVYPLRWEIDIDGVYLDGKLLATSTVPATGGVNNSQVSALIDTGNSLIRGPSDVVNSILTTVSPNYNPSSTNSLPVLDCTAAHTLAFQIGGQMFPVDPRDFISDTKATNTKTCEADNVVATDPPSVGALFRWSLGDPFLKSTLVAFHYGNLTHPSVDPPRIGFLSMVPNNADALLTQAVEDAQSAGGFETTSESAPTASAAAEAKSAVTLVPTSLAVLTGSSSASSIVTVSTTSSASSLASSNAPQTTKTSNGARSLRLHGGPSLQSLCRSKPAGSMDSWSRWMEMGIGIWLRMGISVILGFGVTVTVTMFT
ncbi:aspartic peptidase domain-containing protein [Lentinula aciculospora]|uniref:Aspartic peptidase domain-containing protein n=1 Tax=Lentinula aciculospora TaxID=153920 RepID=A0A9W9ATN7_9AGAR|nr:aspartic peptidase domain-containing protein [Lentinula aciculospora]